MVIRAAGRFGRVIGYRSSSRRRAMRNVGVAGKPSIILFNTAGNTKRSAPPLRPARLLLGRPYHVLRYDLGGIGDSAPPPGAPDNIAYPGHMLDDACEAIAFVRKEAMKKAMKDARPGRVIAAGLCSGGWLAFQAARDGLAVDAVVSINPPMYLRDHNAGVQWVADANEFDRYQHSMRDPSKWLKALSGGAAYAHFMRVSASARCAGPFPPGSAASLARRCRRSGERLWTIARRGVRSTLRLQPRGRWPRMLSMARAACASPIQECATSSGSWWWKGAGHTFRPRARSRRFARS